MGLGIRSCVQSSAFHLNSQKRHRVDASCIKPADFIKLHQVCEHQTCCNLIFADLLKVDETTCIKPACNLQLVGSLLTTCNRLVIIKPKHAMQTHPDIGLVIADLLQLVRFWLGMRSWVRFSRCHSCDREIKYREKVWM